MECLKCFFFPFLSLQVIDLFSEAFDSVGVSVVDQVFLAFLALLEACFHVFHEEIEFVKIHVRKDGCADGALRYTAVGRMIRPVL